MKTYEIHLVSGETYLVQGVSLGIYRDDGLIIIYTDGDPHTRDTVAVVPFGAFVRVVPRPIK